MQKIIKAGLILGLALLTSQQVLAAKTKLFVPIEWESSNSTDVISVESAGATYPSPVMIYVSKGVNGSTNEKIKVSCEGKEKIVGPGSSLLCKVGSDGEHTYPTIKFSSVSNKSSSGIYQID